MTRAFGETLAYSSGLYTLTFASDRPFVYLDDSQGHRLAELFVLSGVQPWEGRDDAPAMGTWERIDHGSETTFTLIAQSSAWQEKRYVFTCRPERLAYHVEVTGNGRLVDVQYFGGYCSAWPRWGSGFFPSSLSFSRGFCPEPNAANVNFFTPEGSAAIDLTGAPLPGKRHWFFNPAPFCFAFEVPSGWLGVGVEAAAGANNFTEYRYHGGDAFYLSLSYDGQTVVNGSMRLPTIGIDFAATALEAISAHVSVLETRHAVPPAESIRPAWWSRPMFCGWGAQCARAAAEHGYRVPDPAHPDIDAFLATMAHASSYARQDVYEDFLAALSSANLDPGTVVIDDKWQHTYGDNRVDEEKWPNLSRFITEQHRIGRRVLLWIKAWDREGVPDDECIVNAAGLPLTVDPTNPAYEDRLRQSIRHMLRAYGADGFKIDFTHRIPVGPGIRTHGVEWGLELMRRYLSIVYRETKVIKPDAMVMTHTPHPYLADLADMIRLNDMIDLTHLDRADDIQASLSLRERVARIGSPLALIDTDNWPVRDKATWLQYIALQPSIGVPSLYFATHIDLTQEPLTPTDYEAIRAAWTSAIALTAARS